MSKKLSFSSRPGVVGADLRSLWPGAHSRKSAGLGSGCKHVITVLTYPRENGGLPVRRSRRYDERVEQALLSFWKAAN